MNADIIIRRIKRSIGIYGIALPIDDLDKLILEIMDDTTLPVFSTYCPHEEIHTIMVDELEHNNRERGEGCELYTVPDSLLQGRELLYVKSVKYDESFLRYQYMPSVLNQQKANDIIGGIYLANSVKPLTDSMINPITFHYEYPRKLFIYDTLVSSRLKAIMCFSHDKSFQSITPTQQEAFFKLAALDVKEGLYATVKHYEGIETAFGRIELKIEDWANAAQERKDLLNEWDDSYLLDAVGIQYG